MTDTIFNNTPYPSVDATENYNYDVSLKTVEYLRPQTTISIALLVEIYM